MKEEKSYPEAEEARKKYDKEKDWLAHQIVDGYCKYKHIAEAIGFCVLARLVPATKEQLESAYETDNYFNEIPLKKWDSMHPLVLHMRRHTRITRGKFPWSLCDSVCLLKFVAWHHILGKSLEERIRHNHLQRRLEHIGRVRGLPD